MSSVSGVQSHVNLAQMLRLSSARPQSAAPADVDRPRPTGGTTQAASAAPDHDGDSDDVGGQIDVRA